MSISREMNRKDLVHIYNGILLSHKRSETGSFVKVWMELETVIPGEVNQNEKKQILYINAYILNPENWYRQSYLQSRSRDTDVENLLF